MEQRPVFPSEEHVHVASMVAEYAERFESLGYRAGSQLVRMRQCGCRKRPPNADSAHEASEGFTRATCHDQLAATIYLRAHIIDLFKLMITRLVWLSWVVGPEIFF